MVDPRLIAFANFMVNEFNGTKLGRVTGFKLNFDGRYGEQCMDLWNWCWTFLGIPSSAIRRTFDAAAVWELDASEQIWNYFDGILPDQIFQPADVFVFNRNAFGAQGRGRGRGFGHIGMVIQDNYDGTFDVLEANGLGDGYEDEYLNQYGSPARVHTWSKQDLYGVLRPIPAMCPGLNDFGGLVSSGIITPSGNISNDSLGLGLGI
jgi:hypothetical protein